MEECIRRTPWARTHTTELDALLTREWLVTNGLGGYAAGTLTGVPTRRYHGLLIAALPIPFGRTLLLPSLSEQLRLPDGTLARLSSIEQTSHPLQEVGTHYLTAFHLEMGLPVWRYEVAGMVLEKRLLMPHGQNTVLITYCLITGENTLRLTLLPRLHFRPHEAPVSTSFPRTDCQLLATAGRYELLIGADQSSLRMMLHGQHTAFTLEDTLEDTMLADVYYRVEARRGYESTGELWSPGYFRVDLSPGNDATLVASTESWETLQALTPNQAWEAEYERRRRLLHAAPASAHTDMAAELVLAADQFIIKPAGRVEDEARVHAAGDEVRTLIAGYHWFTDWGRDTMISLEGLTLTTGRHVEAGYILRTFANYIRDGLIPNLFPEGEKAGLYHTADATLWFFHTPVGLRSLAPDHRDYKPKYDGDLRARDAAYHQGTVWAWLIGPFIDAWLKVYADDRAGARRFLQGFKDHLGEACLGSISEIFDAEEPFTPRGCVAQAWSVAEVLRCWVKTAE